MIVRMLDLARQQATLGNLLNDAVLEVIETAQYAPAAWPSPFESRFAAYCQREFAVGVGSGSSALQIALVASGIESGDEVITTPNSFFATTEAILLCGAVPSFTDVDPMSHLMTAQLVDAALTPRTKAILPVHLFGNVVDVPAIERLLARRAREDVVIIEDCAHAAGAALAGKRVPLAGIGAFSFNPGKNLGALGDAGAIVTSNHKVAELARLLRNHGRTSKNQHQVIGFNSRLRTIDDAVLALKLGHLDQWNAARARAAAQYDAAFAGTLLEPILPVPGASHAYHQYVLRVDDRDVVREELAKREIETAIHYPTLIVDQPPLKRLGWSSMQFPVADRLNRRMLSIPCSSNLSSTQIDYVIEVTKSIVVEVGQGLN